MLKDCQVTFFSKRVVGAEAAIKFWLRLDAKKTALKYCRKVGMALKYCRKVGMIHLLVRHDLPNNHLGYICDIFLRARLRLYSV